MKKYGLGMPGWMAVLVLVLSGAVAQAQDLTLNISDTGFDPVPAGGTIEYSVRLQNGGNTRSAADMLHFAIPAGAAYQGVAGDLEGCSPAPVLQGPASVSCPVPELAPRAELAGSVHLVPAGAGVTTFGGSIGTTTITEDTTVTTGADLGLGFDAPADIRAGDFLTFAAVIANDGPYPSEGTRLTVPLPPALSSDVILPSGCTISGNEITCDIAGPIAVGDDVRLEFTTQILTADASSVSVAGSLSSSQPADPDLSNDENAFVIAISPGTDVRLGKARTPSGLLYVGQPVTFTLSPDFVGDAPLDAQITDDLPANYEFTSVSPSGAGWACHDTNPVECSYSATTPDPAGFRAPITITAVPIGESPAGAPVVNTAVIASSLDLVADNNTASDGGADIVLPTTDLVAEKSGPTHGLVTVGNEYDWRIGARNDGNIGFTGRLVLTDRLPEGLRATAIGAPAGWACTPGVPLSGPAEIVCETDNYTATPLPVGGQTPRITITTEVLAEGRLDNVLQVGFTDETYPDRDMSNNSITRGVTSGDGTTVGIADLALVKTVADPGPHVAGEPVRFTVEVSNSGPGTAEDVRVLDRLSDLYFTDSTTTGVTLDTVPADVGCTVTRGSGFYSDLACTIDELPAGETRSISFTALAGGNAGTRTNTAETYSTATPDPDYANNTGSVTYGVTPRTDVTVAKTASHAAGSDVQAGQRLRYILSASVPANGLSSAENVTVTDQLPAGLKFVSATPSQGVCDDPGATLVDGYLTSSLTEIRCNLGTITNGNTQSVEIVVAPTTQLVSQQIENRVGVETSTPEIDGTNNEAAIIHRVTAPALDLITNKTDDPDPLEINTPTTYTVTVRNAGPSEAFNLVITDTLPDAGMRYDGIVDAGGMACSEQDGAAVGSIGGRLTCTLPNLEVGATATLRVQMTGVQRGHWVNHVEARSDEYGHEAITANNAVSEATSVFERSNLAVTKAPSRAVVDLGEEFDWIITVENRTAAGIGLAENVVLRDMLPAEMVISDTVQTSGGSCDAPPGGRSLVCVLPDMVAGESHVVTVPVRVTSVGANPQDVANSASVETDSFADDPADDTATGTVQVLSTTVSGAIWRDFNENDLRDGPVFPGSFDDRGVGGLTVHLTGTDEWGRPVSRSTTTAAANGSYAFPLLPPGNYSVSFTPPGDGYVANAGSALPNPMTGTASGRTEIRNIDAATDTPVSGNDFTLVPEARIALAKAVAGPILQPDGSYTLRYLFRVDNVSMEPLDDFIVTDHLQTDFGEYVTGTPGPGQFAVVSLTPGTLVSGADDQLVIARTGRMT
ncbi:SdrD B-like domain-containing protein, partial [Pontibaca methylaminivorans]|uniref:SdrD B-like domain-containing protein n=1 Tax=Pontibaca methylaminivorans TaxID=515897 RepID=UPI002FD8AF00